jgi:hypothetical protein
MTGDWDSGGHKKGEPPRAERISEWRDARRLRKGTTEGTDDTEGKGRTARIAESGTIAVVATLSLS